MGTSDGVSVDVSVVANAISPFLGDCPGSSGGDFLEISECPGRFWGESPDILDAWTLDPTDVGGGGIAVVVALEVSAGTGAISAFLGDGAGSLWVELPGASTFAHTDVGVGAEWEDGVADPGSVVAAAISAIRGEDQGTL